jgi:hypothetical protein
VIAETLLVIAYVVLALGVTLAGWGFVFSEPRFMTLALIATGLSMIPGACGELDRGIVPGAVYCGIALLIISVLTWRTWPEGWNPWKQAVDVVMQGRLGKTKAPRNS